MNEAHGKPASINFKWSFVTCTTPALAYNVGGGLTMRRWTVVLLVVLACASQAWAGKQKGTATLKDFQPAGTTDKKNKTQKFDITFDAAGNEYVCRTNDKLKATDFVVGSDVKYELDNDKVKLKNPSGKEAKCMVVRVEKQLETPNAEVPK
jgi:hypothetical protein